MRLVGYGNTTEKNVSVVLNKVIDERNGTVKGISILFLWPACPFPG
jgi:hypothetical protein